MQLQASALRPLLADQELFWRGNEKYKKTPDFRMVFRSFSFFWLRERIRGAFWDFIWGLRGVLYSVVENAPTCYRAPRWSDLEFPRKIPKKYPPARNSGLPEFTPKIPRIYPKNTPKIPKMRIFGILGGIFLVFSWGSRISARGVFFRYFRGNSGSGHLGAL